MLDITIANRRIKENVKKWQVSDEISLSDHKIIFFELNLLRIDQEHFYRNIKNTDWLSYEKDIKKHTGENSYEEISNSRELDKNVEELTNIIMSTFKKNCPEKKVIDREENPIWWTNELSNLRKECRKLRRIAIKQPSKWNNYATILNSYKDKVRSAKRDSRRKFCSDIENT